MQESKLRELSMEFSVDIIELVKHLKSTKESIISNQIGRSGTSIGANIHEAQYAQGKKDFISKLEIALKEANETGYWLELLYRTKYIDEQTQNTFCKVYFVKSNADRFLPNGKGEYKMIYGIVDRKNHKCYTYMSKVFQAINNAQLQYNWLITDCICYPQNNDIEKLLDQEYCWLTGDELSAIIEQEDFQWIWGCLCGFIKDITMEEVLKYPLPSAEDYNGYYQNPVSLQHPLSSVEIVPSDSSWTIVISKDKAITDSYLKSYPKCEDLSSFNQS